MRKEYDKLVRDRIPEIIRKEGRQCEITIMSEEEYRKTLLEKLVEEAKEVTEGNPDTWVTEIADLYEVIETLITVFNIDRQLVLAEQKKRRAERGGFEKRIRLNWAQ